MMQKTDIREVFTLVPSITMTDGASPLLNFPGGAWAIDELHPALQEVLVRLCRDGGTEGELERIVSRGRGDLNVLYCCLEFFRQSGHLRRTLLYQGKKIASLSPLNAPIPARSEPFRKNGKYSFSRYAFFRSDNGAMVIETGLAGVRIELHAPLVAGIALDLVSPVTCGNLILRHPECAPELVTAFISFLWEGWILEPNKASRSLSGSPPVFWQFHDLLFHARSRKGRHCEGFGGTYRFRDIIDPAPVVKRDNRLKRIPLFRPDINWLAHNDRSFTRVLEQRRSVRELNRSAVISKKQLGEFLYRTARIRTVYAHPAGYYEVSSRPYPGGGACYELEIYTVINTCRGLSPGLYHYCPQRHALSTIAGKNAAVERLIHEAWTALSGQSEIQVLFIYAARFKRIMWKYESIAYAVILKNVGVLMQTMNLVATAMDLGGCALGAGDADLFAEAAGTNYYDETSVGEFSLGTVGRQQPAHKTR